ncbi:MAG: (5-formylfuran-3-yl)methyl phosphate synthase [Methanosphaera sp.]|uniref:(5-formylfuran-3-yl)methyl phosphate synthase n=1 Tax=Methanosphaera sp. ISO3-F5 TaxID=1452353 RepID=UPI002B25DE2E|nr:(5-formylfuran-3-yl)methyl phosphate synthase [Methanosphaera sp. ISO3-F5]MBR0472733.1 (5-formylfuran-3-yl)methyl phosphate synthase [Methanosphaera sp.]WQH63253.1 (5-formylfuran-3-yl)methyl phosphate synthase [Methanosphaera sp. ISO3-F5]
MQLLVSAINLDEAKEATMGGADILDVKNPKEGSLGANFPWIIKEISNYANNNIIVSTTIGDVPYKPGTVSLAALGSAVSGSNYVKVGLYGTKTYEEALEVMKAVVKTIKEYDSSITVVACGYADAYKTGSIEPEFIPKVAKDSGSDLAMLDTYIKDGHRLTDHMTTEQLQNFVNTSHNYGLKVALAGSVNKNDVAMLKKIGCDIMGVRGCVCTQGDRNNGTINRELVQDLKDNI